MKAVCYCVVTKFSSENVRPLFAGRYSATSKLFASAFVINYIIGQKILNIQSRVQVRLPSTKSVPHHIGSSIRKFALRYRQLNFIVIYGKKTTKLFNCEARINPTWVLVR